MKLDHYRDLSALIFTDKGTMTVVISVIALRLMNVSQNLFNLKKEGLLPRLMINGAKR